MSKITETAEIKKAITLKILATNKSVQGFARTDEFKNLGLRISPERLSVYLTPEGVISFPVMNKLCSHLGLGKLKKIVKRSVKYELCQED